MTFQQKETIKQLREEGFSYAKIAEQLGISENTIKSFCRMTPRGFCFIVSVMRQQLSVERHCGTGRYVLGKA